MATTNNDADLVKELLDDPNTLNNIAAIRKKLLREKSLVDSQLQTGIQGEIQMLTSGTSALRNITGGMDEVKQTLGHMFDTYRESEKHVPEFEDVQGIAIMLSNFDMTHKFVAHFQEFTEKIELAHSLMARDGEFDINNQMQNLIPTHHILNELRQIRDEANGYLHKKDATSDTRLTLKKLYEPLDMMVERFDANLMMIAEDLLEILRERNASLVVRAAKIIECEERQDIIAKLSQQSNHSSKTKKKGNFGHMKYERKPREYLKRFLSCIEASINMQFDNCTSTFSPDKEPSELLENLKFVNSELMGAKEDLVPCCPERWHIFEKYVQWYHRGVHKTLNAMMAFEPPAEVLLEILQYVKEYYGTMSTVFGVSRKKTPELLEPPLLDGMERNIYDDYLKILVSKLKQWYATIWVSEKRDFESEDCHLVQHADGLGLEAHTTVMKLIVQQLEVAANSGQARVIAGCVDACCEVLMERQHSWIELMRVNTQQAVREDPNAAPGLYEKLFIIANDQDRAYAFLETLKAKWSEPMPPRYQGRVVAKFEEAQEGYQDVTKECFLRALEVIYSDTKPAFDEVMRSDKWYAGVTVQEIVDTYEDFIGDAKKFLMKDLFDIFFGKLCTETILWYLRSMIVFPGGKALKLSMPRAQNRIEEDAKLLYGFFTKEEYGLDAEASNNAFHIFDVLCDVQVVPFEKIPEIFLELRAEEHDAPLDLCEAMVNMRKDVDPKTLRDIMADVRAQVLQKETIASATEGGEQPHSYLYEFSNVE